MDRTKAIALVNDAFSGYYSEWGGTFTKAEKAELAEANRMAIEALGKDIDVPSKSALDHIHNVVRDDAYKRGYEQGKKEAIPVDWLDSYITNHSHGEIVFESIGMMYIRAMIEQWRKEQNGKTD